MKATVKLDQRQLLKNIAVLTRDSEKYVARALNRTASGTQTDTVKQIRIDLNLKAKDIRDTMKIAKASKQKQTASVASSGARVPLIDFGARQTKKGVTVKVKRSGDRFLIKHAFLATMPTGHRDVFFRKKPPDTDPKRHGLKIAKLLGPAVPDFMGNEKAMGVILEKTEARLIENLKSQIDYLLASVK